MKLGVVCWSFMQGINMGVVRTADDLVERAALLDLAGVGIDHQFLPAPDDGDGLSSLRARADASQIRLTAGGVDVATLAAGVSTGETEAQFERAVALGSDVLKSTFFPPGVRLDEGWTQVAAEEHLQRAIEHLRAVEEVARRVGLPLAVENHIDFRNEELVRIWNSIESPWVGLLLDTANQLALLDDPYELVAEIGDRVLSVHLKDAVPVATEDGVDLIWSRPGTGVVDLGRILEAVGARADLTVNLELIVAQQWAVPFRTADFTEAVGSGDHIARLLAGGAAGDEVRPPTGDQHLLAFENEEVKRGAEAARDLVNGVENAMRHGVRA